MNAYAWFEGLIVAAALIGSLLWLANRYAPDLSARLRRKPPQVARTSGCGSGCGSCDTGCSTPRLDEQPIRLHR